MVRSKPVGGAEHSLTAWVQDDSIYHRHWDNLTKTASLYQRHIFRAEKVHSRDVLLLFSAENFKPIRYFAWSEPILPLPMSRAFRWRRSRSAC